MAKRRRDFASEREAMVERHLIPRDISDPAVLDAFRTVPRETFVAKRFASSAYQDRPLPIEERQTISQPFIVALMAQAAELSPDSRVLEIGTGSGYGAAILSRIAAHVWTVERHQVLAVSARERLNRLGYDNVTVEHGDGTIGLIEHAPFDAIVVTAAAAVVPQDLLAQLATNGRLVIPVGDMHETQRLMRYRRNGDEIEEEELTLVRFVELIEGHAEPDSSD